MYSWPVLHATNILGCHTFRLCLTKEHVLWSSSSTQLYFNIDHPAILVLRANSKLKDDLIPENVASLKRQIQTTPEDVEKVTIQQLYDAELPMGKDQEIPKQ